MLVVVNWTVPDSNFRPAGPGRSKLCRAGRGGFGAEPIAHLTRTPAKEVALPVIAAPIRWNAMEPAQRLRLP